MDNATGIEKLFPGTVTLISFKNIIHEGQMFGLSIPGEMDNPSTTSYKGRFFCIISFKMSGFAGSRIAFTMQIRNFLQI
jgi:hypothetical protein